MTEKVRFNRLSAFVVQVVRNSLPPFQDMHSTKLLLPRTSESPPNESPPNPGTLRENISYEI